MPDRAVESFRGVDLDAGDVGGLFADQHGQTAGFRAVPPFEEVASVDERGSGLGRIAVPAAPAAAHREHRGGFQNTFHRIVDGLFFGVEAVVVAHVLPFFPGGVDLFADRHALPFQGIDDASQTVDFCSQGRDGTYERFPVRFRLLPGRNGQADRKGQEQPDDLFHVLLFYGRDELQCSDLFSQSFSSLSVVRNSAARFPSKASINSRMRKGSS